MLPGPPPELRRRRLQPTFRPTPPSLAHEEAASYSLGIHLPALRVNERLLRLDNRARLPLVIYAEHLRPDLELAASRGHGQRLEELDAALAIDNALAVELRNARDGRGRRARVEIDDLLVRVLEGEDDGVGREDGEGGVEFLGRGGQLLWV